MTVDEYAGEREVTFANCREVIGSADAQKSSQLLLPLLHPPYKAGYNFTAMTELPPQGG
jgi:hypothetical protein